MDAFRPFVYTNTLSGTDLKMLVKVDQNETLMKTHIVLVLAVEKRTKIKTMTENIAGACACRMRIGINLRHNVQFVVERFSMDSRKRSKTVVWTRIDRCVVDDNENVYFWKRISVDRASDLKCQTETS